jgi:predicted kinase
VCSAPPEAIQRRVRDRVLADVDVSDADEVIAARLAQRFVPWPTATTIATDGERSSAAAAAVMAVQGTAG